MSEESRGLREIAVREKEGPRKSWEEQPVFRDLFLGHLEEELQESLAQVGELLYTAVLEGGWLKHSPRSHLRGVMLDLETLAAFLASLDEEVDLPGLQSPMTGWQERLSEVARELRRALEPEP